MAAGNGFNMFFGAVYGEMLHMGLIVGCSRASLFCSRNVTRFLLSVGLLDGLVLSIDRGKCLNLISCTGCDVGLHEGSSGEGTVLTLSLIHI